MSVVFSDINSRAIPSLGEQFLTSDAKAVFQSIWRLLTTIEGEIPYYRMYGCNPKKFLQYPLTEQTANIVLEYYQKKVEDFESRGRIINADAQADVSRGILKMRFYVQVIATGETGVLPDLDVIVNRK